MRLRHLWLTDFRSYHQVEVDFPAGLTAIVGANGEGKTNLLEGVAYLATLGSFRGAPVEALVRQGCPAATVRAQVDREGRELLIEAELAAKGRNRIQVNRQRLTGPAICWGRFGSRSSRPTTWPWSRGDRPSVGGTSTMRRWPRNLGWTRFAPRSAGSCASATPCCNRPAVA